MITHITKALVLSLLIMGGGNLIAMEPEKAIVEQYKPETDLNAVKQIYMLNWFRPVDAEKAFPILLSPEDLGDKASEKLIWVLRHSKENKTICGYASYYFYPKREDSHKGWIEKLEVDTQLPADAQVNYNKQLLSHVLAQLNLRYAKFVNNEQSLTQKALININPDLITTDYGVHTNPLVSNARQELLKKHGFIQLKNVNGWEYGIPFTK